MKARKPHLTAMERTFSGHMAKTGDRIYSAEKAGYAFPAQAAAKLVNNPVVKADMQKFIEDELNDLVPLSTLRIRKVLQDDSQKGSVHIAAAKLVLDQANKRAGGAERDLSEMTSAEILDLLALTRRRLVTIDVTPESPPIAQPAPNLFD